MLKKQIKSALEGYMAHTPTPGQSELIEKLVDFILSTYHREVFLVKGYAGTGKTTMVSTLVKTLKKLRLKSVLLAPTGRAAKVLTSYSKKNAYTIHKKIYRQKSANDSFAEFSLDKNLHTDTIFIVDEASMLSNYSPGISIFGSGCLLDDLVKYVFNGQRCKLILIGDTAQLPPVGLDISPAFNRDVLEGYGVNVTEVYLRDVVRQSEQSGILHNATMLRKQMELGKDDYPKIQLKGFPDIERVAGSELIELINDTYDKYGIEDTMIVSRSNKRANKFNEGIRRQILWREEEISAGDYLMVVKNNYHWLQDNKELDFIANGDIVEITRIKKIQEVYGFRFADVSVRFIDYQDIEIDVKIILDSLTVEAASLSSDDNKKLYYSVLEDYKIECRSKRKLYEKVKEDPYFNALQVKFAYAVTCHKSQGGQWKAIFVDQGFLKDDMINREYLRWLYTAFTRPTEKLYLINFNKEFFEEEE